MSITISEMAEVMKAHKEGKEIEVRERDSGEWQDDFHPSWDWCRLDYRVKEGENNG